jgi:small subunit ribosomal protein S4
MLKTNSPSVKVNKATSGRRGSRRPSEYGLKLREKQKVKEVYQLGETTLRASLARCRPASLLAFLERRLDNALYRLGAVASRRAARQFVAHGRVKVNGRRVTVPSYLLRAGDKLDLEGVTFVEEVVVPGWLKLDKKRGKAVVWRLPESNEVEPDIDERLVFEYYAKW